jgi:putative transposase
MGNLLAIVVHAANIHDTKSGMMPTLEAFERHPTIQRFCADAGYRGIFVSEIHEVLGLGVDISEKVKPHEWEKLPWRWIVERTFAWSNNSRRLSKDYEITIDSAETIFKISHIGTLLRRL